MDTRFLVDREAVLLVDFDHANVALFFVAPLRRLFEFVTLALVTGNKDQEFTC